MLKYREDKNISDDELNSLFKRAGWSTRFSWFSLLNATSFVISAWNEKELVGLCRLFEENGTCTFYDLVVDPKFRRKHIATEILKRIEQKAIEIGYKAISPNTSINEVEAQKLYEKNGYVEIKRILVGTPEERIYFEKRLKC